MIYRRDAISAQSSGAGLAALADTRGGCTIVKGFPKLGFVRWRNRPRAKCFKGAGLLPIRLEMFWVTQMLPSLSRIAASSCLSFGNSFIVRIA